MKRFNFLTNAPRYRIVADGFCSFRSVEAYRRGYENTRELYMKSLKVQGDRLGADRIDHIREVANPHQLKVEVHCVYLAKS
jgi:hypothetical protein